MQRLRFCTWSSQLSRIGPSWSKMMNQRARAARIHPTPAGITKGSRRFYPTSLVTSWPFFLLFCPYTLHQLQKKYVTWRNMLPPTFQSAFLYVCVLWVHSCVYDYIWSWQTPSRKSRGYHMHSQMTQTTEWLARAVWVLSLEVPISSPNSCCSKYS